MSQSVQARFKHPLHRPGAHRLIPAARSPAAGVPAGVSELPSARLVGRQTAIVMPAAAGHPVWFVSALVKDGSSAHDPGATLRLMSDRRDPKPPERSYEQGKARQQRSEETQEGSRSQSSRPAGKSGADGRKHASTKEAVADQQGTARVTRRTFRSSEACGAGLRSS